MTSDLTAEVEIIMAVSCMRNASGHNYGNSSFIVDLAMGQIPRSTERISASAYLFDGNVHLASL